jgi:DNA modification methylase
MENMKSYLHFDNTPPAPLPPEFSGDDVRFPQNFARHFIQEYTQPGQVVFDPFAGFGTTLLTAESLDRIPSGIEFDPRRAAYIQSRLQRPESLIQGDARRMSEYDLPYFDFSLTSPPYMSKNDPEDPFSAYTRAGRGYPAYLQDLQQIYAQVRQKMNPDAHVVVEVSNLKDLLFVTTLAWDVAAALSQVLTFQGEIVLAWDHYYGYGYDHSYALVFSR